MRVFVTGATGFIGSAVVAELIDDGHEVVGLARSDRGCRSARGGRRRGPPRRPRRPGQPAQRRRGGGRRDPLAYIHDFSQMEMAAQADQRAIETLGAALEGSDRPLVVTSGTALIGPRTVATEEDSADRADAHPRGQPTDSWRWPCLARRARLDPAPAPVGARRGRSRLRPDPDRDRAQQGRVRLRRRRHQPLAGGAPTRRRAPLSPRAGDGAGRARFAHAVGEEGVPTREIAEVIGRHLDLPVGRSVPRTRPSTSAGSATFFALDVPASSALTRERIGLAARRSRG